MKQELYCPPPCLTWLLVLFPAQLWGLSEGVHAHARVHTCAHARRPESMSGGMLYHLSYSFGVKGSHLTWN